MNQAANGPLPWAELARDIRPVSGKVPMRWQVAVGTMFHQGRPWAFLGNLPQGLSHLAVINAAVQLRRPKPAGSGKS